MVKKNGRSQPYTVTTKTKRQSKKAAAAEKDDVENMDDSSQDVINEATTSSETMTVNEHSEQQNTESVSSNSSAQISRSEFDSLKLSVDNILMILQNKNKTHEVPLFCNSLNSTGNSTNVAESAVGGENSMSIEDQLRRGVQHAIAPHVSTIVQEPGKSVETFMFIPTSRPIDMKVSDKLKSKIWADQYVDFNLLLEPDQTVESLELVSGEDDKLTLIPSKQQKPINNLGSWCNAFMIFLTIYCKKYPLEISNLTQYMNTVKMLAYRNGDYIKYDREFRYLKQTNSAIKWQDTISDLWLECRDPVRVQNSKNQPKNKSNQSNNFRGSSGANKSNTRNVPLGYCFAFHGRGFCARSNCMFSHVCFNPNCGERHPVSKCTKGHKNSANKSDKSSDNFKGNANASKTK